MKTITSVTSAVALAILAAGAANAQVAFETRSTSTTQTLGNVTTNVQTQYVSTTTVVPIDGATPAVVADGVKVKLPSGEIVSVADSADAPWNKDAKLQGYSRFTFDPESGAFIATKGDDKYADKWDENGNPVAKKAPAPVKKKVVKKAKKVAAPDAEAAPATEEAPASEAPANEAPAGDVSAAPAQ